MQRFSDKYPCGPILNSQHIVWLYSFREELQGSYWTTEIRGSEDDLQGLYSYLTTGIQLRILLHTDREMSN
jgi:hypothetical protein